MLKAAAPLIICIHWVPPGPSLYSPSSAWLDRSSAKWVTFCSLEYFITKKGKAKGQRSKGFLVHISVQLQQSG